MKEEEGMRTGRVGGGREEVDVVAFTCNPGDGETGKGRSLGFAGHPV